MEERTRLGRGLEEVTRLYLSGRHREASAKEPGPGDAPRGRRAIRVFYPGSPVTKSLFMANFALELARGRRPVLLWDGAAGEEAGAGRMLEGVIRSDLVPDVLAVRLFGLPDVIVYDPAAHPEGKLDELARAVELPGGDEILLISLVDTLESVIQSSVPFDAVMLCPLDEGELLKTYAFIKVIRESDPMSRVHLVFDDPPSEERAREIFSRLDAFTRERLLGPLSYLGVLCHDDALSRSMEERMPVVLSHDESEVRDCFKALGEAFLASARDGGQGGDAP